jgi:hypothetical protein
LIISHKHRFIFITTHKTAGTSIGALLSQLAGPDAIVPPTEPLSPTDATVEARNWKGFFNPVPEIRRTLKDGAPVNGPLPRVLGGGIDPPTRGRTSSVLRSLYQFSRRVNFFGHTSAWLIRERLGMEMWESYFKFCIERNPWDKAISIYGFRAPDPENVDFNDWVLNDRGQLESDWPLYAIDGKVAVDYVGRFENLEHDLRQALNQVGVVLPDSSALPKAHVSHRRRVTRISSAASERIREVFKNEIQEFGYAEPTEAELEGLSEGRATF